MLSETILEEKCSWCEANLATNGESTYCNKCGWWDAYPTRQEIEAENATRKSV